MGNSASCDKYQEKQVGVQLPVQQERCDMLETSYPVEQGPPVNMKEDRQIPVKLVVPDLVLIAGEHWVVS